MARMVSRVALVVAGFVAGAGATAAPAEIGQVLPDVTLPRLDGGSAPLLERGARATAVVFFRAPHERSEQALRTIAGCAPQLAGKPVRLVGVVLPEHAGAAAEAVGASGAKLPLLVDSDESLHGTLGVRLHPVIAIVDAGRRLVALDPVHQVATCDVLVARVRRVLGEIGDAELARALSPAASELPESARDVARRHVALGRKLLATRAFGAAHESARKAIAAAPSGEAWRLEGEIFAAERRCPEATRAFDAALALDPKDAAAQAARQGCGG